MSGWSLSSIVEDLLLVIIGRLMITKPERHIPITTKIANMATPPVFSLMVITKPINFAHDPYQTGEWAAPTHWRGRPPIDGLYLRTAARPT